MSDLLLIVLLMATLNNVGTYLVSLMRSLFVRYRGRKTRSFTYASIAPYYEGKVRRVRLRQYFYVNGVFYSLLTILVANTVLDFALAMALILLEYRVLFELYTRQKPTYYVTPKGIICQIVVHPMDRDLVGVHKIEALPRVDIEVPVIVTDRAGLKIS